MRKSFLNSDNVSSAPIFDDEKFVSELLGFILSGMLEKLVAESPPNEIVDV